jgi:hypothetical protein
MAAALSLYQRNRLLNYSLRESGPIYISLHLTDPGDVYVSGEVTAPEYQRRLVEFGPALEGCAKSTNEITFPVGQSDWGIIKFFALWDGSGNMIYRHPVKEERRVSTNNFWRFNAGQVLVYLDKKPPDP